MEQSEIDAYDKQLLQDYPFLEDTGFIYEIKHVINAANKSKATILRKLHDPDIIAEINDDLKETKNSRGNKKYLFTLNGIRKLVSIINDVEFEQIKNKSISDMQKLTKFEKNDELSTFKKKIMEKTGKNWKELIDYFENNIEHVIIEQKEKIADLKYDISFLNEDWQTQQTILEEKDKRIAQLEEINDLLREKIDYIHAYHELKKDTNK